MDSLLFNKPISHNVDRISWQERCHFIREPLYLSSTDADAHNSQLLLDYQSRTKPALWTEVVLNPNPSLRDCPGHDAKAVWDRIYNGYRIQCIPLKRPTDDIWPSRLHGQIFWWSQMSPCIVIMLGYNQPDVLSETSAVCSYNRYGLWHGSYIRYRLY